MNIVCIGAHPDDAEIYAGGALIQWAREGHHVVALSVTRGDIGHHIDSGDSLAARRAAESEAAAAHGGYIAGNLGFGDGHVAPDIQVREAIVRALRTHQADVVLTHRPWDYHPDHRYSAMAVQDAAYMVMVPHFCPDTPALRRNPVFLYMQDYFTKPLPFSPDIIIDVGPVIDDKFQLLDLMPSQIYEWLPWVMGIAEAVPEGADARREWLRLAYGPLFKRPAEAFRESLLSWYGERGREVQFAEAFELCEYGTQPDRDELARLFSFADFEAS